MKFILVTTGEAVGMFDVVASLDCFEGDEEVHVYLSVVKGLKQSTSYCTACCAVLKGSSEPSCVVADDA